MTADIIIAIRRALRAQLLTIAALPPDGARQWDSMLDFTPPADGSAWIRETLDRPTTEPLVQSVGTMPLLKYTGTYTVTLFFPPDADGDVHDLETPAEMIRDAFPPSLVLTHDGVNVTCEGAGIGTNTTVLTTARPMVSAPVRITWWARAFNPI